MTALCLVHCAGVAFLAPLAPVLTAALDDELVEWIGVALSAALVPWGVAAWRGPARRRAAWAGGLSTATALAGLLATVDAVTQAALAGLAVLQLASAIRRSRDHRACCGAECSRS